MGKRNTISTHFGQLTYNFNSTHPYFDPHFDPHIDPYNMAHIAHMISMPLAYLPLYRKSLKGSLFFQDMSTNDQMSLLHETWSELVLLDHIYRQVWFSNQENILLVTGASASGEF